MEFLSIYGSYVKIFLKSRMEYRISFFTGLTVNFYRYFISYITFWALVQRFNSIEGWSFEEMTVLYGLNVVTYAIAGIFFWYTVYHLENEITSGNLDSYLIRPMGVIKQMMCRRFGDTFLGQILVTIVFMILAIYKINYRMTFFSYIYLVFAIIGGIFFQAGAMIILGSLSFWLLRTDSLSLTLYYDIRSMIQYPLTIFPQYIGFILTFILPYAIINYYPSLIILTKVQTGSDLIIGLLSPLIGVMIFALSIFIFNRGLRRYSGSGS